MKKKKKDTNLNIIKSFWRNFRYLQLAHFQQLFIITSAVWITHSVFCANCADFLTQKLSKCIMNSVQRLFGLSSNCQLGSRPSFPPLLLNTINCRLEGRTRVCEHAKREVAPPLSECSQHCGPLGFAGCQAAVTHGAACLFFSALLLTIWSRRVIGTRCITDLSACVNVCVYKSV